MARKPRIHYPGAFYHVMLRGNAKQAIFDNQEDIRRFEQILAQCVEKSQILQIIPTTATVHIFNRTVRHRGFALIRPAGYRPEYPDPDGGRKNGCP